MLKVVFVCVNAVYYVLKLSYYLVHARVLVSMTATSLGLRFRCARRWGGIGRGIGVIKGLAEAQQRPNGERAAKTHSGLERVLHFSLLTGIMTTPIQTDVWSVSNAKI